MDKFTDDIHDHSRRPAFPKHKIYRFPFTNHVVFITIALIVFFGYQIFFEENRNIEVYRDDCYSELKRQVHGVVSDAFYDDNINVKAFVIFFTNGEKYVTPIFLKSLNGYIEKGDSISKIPGTFRFEIFKNGEAAPIILEDTVNCENWFK